MCNFIYIFSTCNHKIRYRYIHVSYKITDYIFPFFLGKSPEFYIVKTIYFLYAKIFHTIFSNAFTFSICRIADRSFRGAHSSTMKDCRIARHTTTPRGDHCVRDVTSPSLVSIKFSSSLRSSNDT